MKYFFSFTLLILICWLSSCKKEPHIEPELTISKYGVDSAGIPNIKMMRRLAFGKCVALALENNSFRNYISRHSMVPGESFFKEIIFNQHKDSLIGNKTLTQILNEVADQEIKNLFGENLLSEIIEYDPCLVIKIPDIFVNFNWETDHIVPYVYVNTSDRVRRKVNTVFGIEEGLLAYHYSGKSEFIRFTGSEFYKIKHFYITVKYSEDYSLINTANNLNELGYSFFNVIPQIQNCWSNIKQDVFNESKLSSKPGWIYIPKFKAFEIWREKCGSTGPYLSDDPQCLLLDCHRDCVSNGGKFVLQRFKPSEQGFVNWFSVYEETFNMGFFYTEPNEIIISPKYCVLPAWRKSQMGCNNISNLKLQAIKYSFNNKEYLSPEIEIIENWGKCQAPATIEINFLATEMFPQNLNLIEQIVLYNQNDISRLINISPLSEFNVYASDMYTEFQINVPYCFNLNQIDYLSHEMFYKY